MRSVLLTLGFVLVAQTAAAQTPILVSRQPLTWAWDAVTTNEAGQPITVTDYEMIVRGPDGRETFTATGSPATTWIAPIVPAGVYMYSVSACLIAVELGRLCGARSAPASVQFINPTLPPGAPGNLRYIVPPQQVLNDREIRQLADSFSYVHRLEPLRPSDMAYLQGQYPGPFPITYESELLFLNAQLAALLMVW